MQNTITKASLCAILRELIMSRPGFETGNYHTYAAYRSDARRSLRDRDDAMKLLDAAEYSDSVTLSHLRDALSSARRLSLSDDGQRLDYCAGQYYPTEYRAAACSALASAWWNAIRDDLTASAHSAAMVCSPWRDAVTGGRIRKYARSRFGSTIAHRWF